MLPFDEIGESNGVLHARHIFAFRVECSPHWVHRLGRFGGNATMMMVPIQPMNTETIAHTNGSRCFPSATMPLVMMGAIQKSSAKMIMKPTLSASFAKRCFQKSMPNTAENQGKPPDVIALCSMLHCSNPKFVLLLCTWT